MTLWLFHEKGNFASQKNILALGIQEDKALKAISDFLTHINIYSYQIQNFKLWLCNKEDSQKNHKKLSFVMYLQLKKSHPFSQFFPNKICYFNAA